MTRNATERQTFEVTNDKALVQLVGELERHGYKKDTYFGKNVGDEVHIVRTYTDETFCLWKSKDDADGVPLFHERSVLVPVEHNERYFSIVTKTSHFSEGDTISNIDYPNITRKIHAVLADHKQYVVQLTNGTFDVETFEDVHTQYELVPDKVIISAGWKNLSLQKVATDDLHIHVTGGTQEVDITLIEMNQETALTLAQAINDLYTEGE